MDIVKHPSNTHTFGPPIDYDRDRDPPIISIPATVAHENDAPVVRTFWKPTDLELAALRNGGTVCLTVMGESMPPVRLTVDLTK